MNNNYLNLYRRLQGRRYAGAGTMGTSRSVIQTIMESHKAMDMLRDHVRTFTEHYNTNNAIFGITPEGAAELTTGLFVVDESFTDQEQALKALHMWQAIQLYGLEGSRIYRTGHVVESMEQCHESDVVININTLQRMDTLDDISINEGGHVFGEGSDPIAREDIPNTLDAWLKEIKRLFPKVAQYWDNPITLGSVGKKDFSGDIDIAIDDTGLKNPDDWDIDPQELSMLYSQMLKRARTASPQDVMRSAVIKSIGNYINTHSKIITTDTKSTTNGVLFSLFDQIGQDGKPNGKTVQIDTNFGNIDWLRFAYYSDSYAGNVKGLHRTQLLLHLFTAKGFMFKHNKGVQNKETLEWVATNPDEAIVKLNELYRFNIDEKTIQNYDKLQEYLRANVDKTTLDHIYDIYLKTLDSTRCDIPEDLQPYWVENKDRLGLTGKFLPNDSQLAPLAK